MFGGHPVSGYVPVQLFVLFAQGILFASFFRHGGVAVDFLQTHVAGVGDGFGIGVQSDARLPEQPEVVAAARFVGDADDPARRLVHDELRLQRVALFLAGVEPALFF